MAVPAKKNQVGGGARKWIFTICGRALIAASDRRIKQNIRQEGRIESLNLTVYSWEYKIAPVERFFGVMAKDLLAREDLCAAVFTFDKEPFDGFYGVDYAALGLRCLPEEAFEGVSSMIIEAPEAVEA